MFSSWDNMDALMFGGALGIVIIAVIIRQTNKNLDPLQLELKALPFVFGLVLFLGFFVLLRTPVIYVHPDSSSVRIKTIEEAEDAISKAQRNLEYLSEDTRKFQQVFLVFFIATVTGLFPAMYKILRLLVNRVSDLNEARPLSEMKKPVLGLNDE